MSTYEPIQIAATLGPSSSDEATLEAMLRAGVQVARLNFSWGTHEDHQRFVHQVRLAAGRLGRRIIIMQDLSGPRVQEGVCHTFDPEADVVTDKDLADIDALVDLEINYVAQSFARDAADIEAVRSALAAQGSAAKVIAKVERLEALENLDEILTAADGVLVGCGDLSCVVPTERLPFVIKDIVRRARHAHVPCMVLARSEASVVPDTPVLFSDAIAAAQLVLDGASALLLSHETATGDRPVDSIANLRSVVDTALKHASKGSIARFTV
ncbi:hypothetical protein CL655_03910 [bacterium]|nr:hypothetical protein [bacterium]|tara:strand:- start:2260 stop:3066 length:807 start_codon:yes stop_codon:yes gene_type:complete